MVNIAIGSAFRNCGPNAMRYMERVRALQDWIEDEGTVRVIAVEGDSVDNTRQALSVAAEYHNIPLDLVTCNHGGPMFGSTEAPERMVALSKVGNAIFDAVQPTDDLLFYVESDLIWEPEVADDLLRFAYGQAMNYDVFAPLVMAGRAFYDIWGFRWLNGERWSPFVLDADPVKSAARKDDVLEVSSVGSCLAMRGEVARNVRIRNEYCLVGWCEDARAQGYRIGVHCGLRVHQL